MASGKFVFVIIIFIILTIGIFNVVQTGYSSTGTKAPVAFMNARTIIFVILTLLLVYIVFNYLLADTNKISTMQSGQTMITVDPGTLATSTNTSNYAYSIWFYVDNWNYRYGEPKVIFGRMGAQSSTAGANTAGANTAGANTDSTATATATTTGTASASANTESGVDPCPSVVLAPTENNVIISLACYPGDQTSASTPKTGHVVHNVTVANVPIQKWVNLLISVYGRTLDVYIDGKLVKTSILPGIAYVNQNSPVYITPNGGFSGWTSELQYWANALDPQTAWNIYAKGYGGSSWFGNDYKVQVAFLKNGQTQGSISV